MRNRDINRYEEVRVEILVSLRELGVRPRQPVGMYRLGNALLPQFTNHEIVDGVIGLQDRRILELLNANRLQLR